MRLLLLLLLLLPPSLRQLTAQAISFTPAYPTVSHNGRLLPLAWFGGLNAPQPQAGDLDGDGNDDIFIFDKAGEVMLAMRSDGSGNYLTAPELLHYFPDSLTNWVQMRDFDQDGAPDLFVHAGLIDAVSVYKGRRRADGLLDFRLMDFGGPFSALYFPLDGRQTEVFVSSIDYPGIADVDGDGDLDILTFATQGGYMEYYENQSVERSFGLDTLLYELVTECWGGFFESGITTALDLAAEPTECFAPFTNGNTRVEPRHSGSTVALLDYDGNGLMDVMLGDISFDHLTLGLNGGSRRQAWINDQDTLWQDDGAPLDIRAFPAAFHLDVDQDGAKDLLGAPSITLRADDVDVMWYYRNEGTDAAPNFVFQQPDKFISDMIDVGIRSNVTVFDYDVDGRPDLVVGNEIEYADGNVRDSRLRLLRNVTPDGGATAFELIDEDYLGMSAFRTTGWAFSPTFGDLDGDGDEDVVIGVNDGKLFYGENTAGAGNPVAFAPLVFAWQGIDAGQFAKPFIADLDRDGRNDLLVGGFDGRTRFYRNIGTATIPAFNPDPGAAGNALQLGGMNANNPGTSTGHPSPWVLQPADHTLVLLGNRRGDLQAYRFGIDSAYTEPFATVSRALDGLSVGGFSNPAFADFNGDGALSLVTGTERGGITFYDSNLELDGTTGLFGPAPTLSFAPALAPNPTDNVVNIRGWLAGEVDRIDLLDVTGRLVRSERIGARTQVQWQLGQQRPGAYLVRLSGRSGAVTRKLIVKE